MTTGIVPRFLTGHIRDGNPRAEIFPEKLVTFTAGLGLKDCEQVTGASGAAAKIQALRNVCEQRLLENRSSGQFLDSQKKLWREH